MRGFQEQARECTVGVAFLPDEMIMFKNRDLSTDVIAKNLFSFYDGPRFRALRAVNLKTKEGEGVSIGVNRDGVCVANTHVVTTPDPPYDALCEEILAKARARGDVPRIARAYVKAHALQGGRMLVASVGWGYLIEVFRHTLKIEELRGNRAITNHFALVPRREAAPRGSTANSRARERAASRLLSGVAGIQDVENLLRTHTPWKGPVSICRHGRYYSTESSHIIRIAGRRITWSHLVGRPCEHAYRTVTVV